MIPQKVKYIIDPNVLVTHKIPVIDYLKFISKLNGQKWGRKSTKLCEKYFKSVVLNMSLIDFKNHLIDNNLLLTGEFIVQKKTHLVLDIKSSSGFFTCSECSKQTQNIRAFIQHLVIVHKFKLKEFKNHFFPKPQKKKNIRISEPKHSSGKLGTPKFVNFKAGKEDAFFKSVPGSFESKK